MQYDNMQYDNMQYDNMQINYSYNLLQYKQVLMLQ